MKMQEEDLIAYGSDGLIPRGDAARQAIASLRGYAYQVIAAALAWLDVDATSKIFLEVAEDYAVVANGVINAVQVKDTQATRTVTLNTDSVREAIANFVSLVELNPNADVRLRFFTTSEIGVEKTVADRPAATAGLIYWRSAATGADVLPLRKALDNEKFPQAVRDFVQGRDDDELRRDLLRKISWDCGKPDIISLRKEFQERLVVIARDKFGIPAPDSLQISNLIVHHVLEKSVASVTRDRVLTRAGLISLIDHASRISISRASLGTLVQSSSSILAHLCGREQLGPLGASSLPPWLADGSDLPKPRKAIPRPKVEGSIEETLRTSGCCFVVGASGVGKSSVSRTVAERVGGNYFIVDFRNANFDDTRLRFDALLSRLGGIRAQAIILEDLNHFNDPAIAPLAARIFEALSRRDIAVIATSYAAPTINAISKICKDPSAIVACPYFSEEESSNLVDLHGGDVKIWGKLAHVSGAFGHPQLVHAFIIGMATRGWPKSEIPDILNAGLSTGDVSAERDAARRSILAVLPEDARSLLYRLSMTIGDFNRSTALSVAAVPPPIVRAGEALSILIGPWIETIGKDKFRVSPLAGQSGRDMLLPEQQKAVHSAIASQFFSGSTIDASDIDKIILHSILGKNEVVLISLTAKLLTSGEQSINFLADSLTLLRVFETSKPIYPENSYISASLRLVQFKVLAAGQDKSGVRACVIALLREIDQVEVEQARELFQVMSLGTVLGVMGIANYVEDWIDLILKFQAIANGNEASKALFTDLESQPGMGGSIVGVLFAIGASNLTSVVQLEEIFERLDKLEPETREMLLRPIGEATSDYSVLINSPWVAEQHNGLNAIEAAERYRLMAIQTATWGFRALTIQCWIARAIMLDEYAKDPDGALIVLEEALAELGDDILISRAQAKVYWRQQDHAKALSILRGIADEVGKDNVVERAFALREAAISAANCGDWELAETWLLEGKAAAAQAKLPDMRAMSIGLGADAAVASFKSGQITRSLRGLADAVAALDDIESGASLQCAHCHHLVRHTVLWLKSVVEERDVLIGDEPIVMRPGMCGNPEPVKEIAQRPLGTIDIAWYMLAEIELDTRAEAGIFAELCSRIHGEPIPLLEVSVRTKQLASNIEDTKPIEFINHLPRYVEGMVYLSQTLEAARELDLLEPKRATIPTLSSAELWNTASQFGDDAIFAFAISCICRRVPEKLLEFSQMADLRFGEVLGDHPLSRIMSSAQRSPPESFEDVLIDTASAFARGIHATPKDYCLAGVRFYQQAQRSRFKSELVPIIASWQRSVWSRIVVSETFRLIMPLRSTPALQKVLSFESDCESFLCLLLLSGSEATGVKLPRELRADFNSLAGLSAPS
jgi:hypothetical protein